MKIKIPFLSSESMTIPLASAVLAVAEYEIAPAHILELASTAVMEII